MQFKSNWLSGMSFVLSTMLLLSACNEKADYSGNDTKKPAEDSKESSKPNDIDAQGESKTSETSQVESEKKTEDKEKPAETAKNGNDQNPAIEDLFGKWVMKDTGGKVLATVTYSSSILSRQIASLKQYDFKITSTDIKDGLVYTVHIEPILNRDTSRHCIHKIVKDPASTYMLVLCENGVNPKIDWSQFTAENRYHKVN